MIYISIYTIQHTYTKSARGGDIYTLFALSLSLRFFVYNNIYRYIYLSIHNKYVIDMGKPKIEKFGLFQGRRKLDLIILEEDIEILHIHAVGKTAFIKKLSKIVKV